MSQALARLGTAIRERREELDLTQQEAARLANVSDTTWHTAEHGKANVALRSLKGIERALNWAQGSAKRVLEGGEPIEGSPGPPYRARVVRHGDQQATTLPMPDDSTVSVQPRGEEERILPDWMEARFEALEREVAELRAELAEQRDRPLLSPEERADALERAALERAERGIAKHKAKRQRQREQARQGREERDQNA